MNVSHSIAGRVHVLQSDDSKKPVWVELVYASIDPYAVAMTFKAEGQTHRWLVGRDLLLAGSSDTFGVGNGDVGIKCDTRHLWLKLDPHDGQAAAIVLMPLAWVRGFLAKIYGLIPAGCESDYLDVDRDIRELLG